MSGPTSLAEELGNGVAPLSRQRDQQDTQRATITENAAPFSPHLPVGLVAHAFLSRGPAPPHSRAAAPRVWPPRAGKSLPRQQASAAASLTPAPLSSAAPSPAGPSPRARSHPEPDSPRAFAAEWMAAQRGDCGHHPEALRAPSPTRGEAQPQHSLKIRMGEGFLAALLAVMNRA